MWSNTTGSGNVAQGYAALSSNQSGSNNVALGNQAGASNINGSGNIFIGSGAGAYETGSNTLYIDNSATTSPLIKGDFANDTVTINGDMTVAGALKADSFTDSQGNSLISKDTATGEITITTTRINDVGGSPYVRKDTNTGAIHIGENSMVLMMPLVQLEMAETLCHPASVKFKLARIRLIQLLL